MLESRQGVLSATNAAGPILPARAVFLDRDGVLNRNVFYSDTGEYESPRACDAVQIVPGAAAALVRLREEGFRLILVSNQPNAAKGKCSREALDQVHAAVIAQLAEGGARLDACYYCFHHPAHTGPCRCRKPSPRFLFEAAARFHLVLKQCWMIGDRATDIACGQSAGARTIRIHNANEGPLLREHDAADFHTCSVVQAGAQVLAAAPPARRAYEAAGRCWAATAGL